MRAISIVSNDILFDEEIVNTVGWEYYDFKKELSFGFVERLHKIYLTQAWNVLSTPCKHEWPDCSELPLRPLFSFFYHAFS